MLTATSGKAWRDIDTPSEVADEPFDGVHMYDPIDSIDVAYCPMT